ncbi:MULTISPECIES: NAD(P)/FAD-dependent oxidoreductase [unclassified Blastococcus]
MSTAATRVVVVGAGYAGLIATNRLLGSLSPAERPAVEVTVVNARPDFVERVRLHELAAGSRESVSRPLAGLLHPDAELVVGYAERVDPGAGTVRVATADGIRALPFDRLVYAVGSTAAAPVPGAREHAYLLGDLDGAAAAATAIRAVGSGVRITVVGGGFTGVEAAAEVAERHPDAHVRLLAAGPLVPTMRPAARRSLLRALRRLGVEVAERTAVAALEEGKAVLADGRVEAFDVCLLAASFDVPGLARDSGLPVDDTGRLLVDATLRSPADPRIVGAGDAVAVAGPAGAHLRMGCAMALPLGGTAAATVLAALRGEEPRPLSAGYLVQCLSLGRRRGYVQVVRADDSPRALHLGGRAAATVKEQICRMVVTAPAAEATRPGAYRWPGGPRRGAGA